MKQSVIIFVFLACFLSAHAQNGNNAVNLRPPRPKVGVVLGGGGAKGASHIGVLKYIEEMGIPVDYVAGTSMGSIIGGLYAIGYTPDELTQLISQMDWNAYIGNKIDRTLMSDEVRKRNSTTLFNIPFGLKNLFDQDPNSKLIGQLPSAYVNNSSLINLFNDLCIGYQEDMDFNDLPIPFACVSTDLITGQEVVLHSGNVPTAMRASMAIPGVFAPVTYGDMILIDGGLVNNFPADVLHDMGADIIIGVEVAMERNVSPNDLKSLPQVLSRLVSNSTNMKREENRALCNIYITPEVSDFGMLSFTPSAIDTLVERGYAMASRYHDKFQAVKDALNSYSSTPISKELHAPKAKNLATDSVMLNSVDFASATERQSKWLIRKGQLWPGKYYVQHDIEHAIGIYRGTGCFDDITYTLKERDSLHAANQDRLSEAYNLTINMKPAHPHVLGVGMRYDTEEGAALLLNFGMNEKKFGGSKLNFTTKLSYNPRIAITYTYARPSLANFSLAYSFRNEHFMIDMKRHSNLNLQYIQNKASIYISQFHLLNVSTTVGLSYVTTAFNLANTETLDTLIGSNLAKNRLLSPYVTVEYDNLDDAYFAKHGFSTRLSSHYYYDTKTTENKIFDLSYAMQACITPADGPITLIPQAYGRFAFNMPINYYFNLTSFCGNEIAGRHFEEQMPFIGINNLDQLTNMASIFRCDLRYNIYGKHYLTAMYNLLSEWNTSEFSSGAGLKYSYKSLLGPISLTVHWTDHEDLGVGAYFSFGYTF